MSDITCLLYTSPGSHIFPYIQENLDEIITVEDDELIVAFLDMVENHKMIVENSGHDHRTGRLNFIRFASTSTCSLSLSRT